MHLLAYTCLILISAKIPCGCDRLLFLSYLDSLGRCWRCQQFLLGNWVTPNDHVDLMGLAMDFTLSVYTNCLDSLSPTRGRTPFMLDLLCDDRRLLYQFVLSCWFYKLCLQTCSVLSTFSAAITDSLAVNSPQISVIWWKQSSVISTFFTF